MTTVAEAQREAESTGDDAGSVTPRSRDRGPWPFWVAAAVLILGLLITGALALVSASLFRSNEKRLLGLRAREIATVLTEVVPSIQTPLASAAALANATGGDVRKFKRFAAPYVGLGSQPFVSMSLWRVRDPGLGPLAVVGANPTLGSSTQRAPALFAHAAATPRLTVIGFLRSAAPRLGYAFTGAGPGSFAAYGESALPSDRYAPVQNNAAFSDIDYAVYLGPSTKDADLIVASVRHLPLSGRINVVRTPIGDNFLTVAVTARGPLGGSLPQRLPAAIAIVGVLLSLGAGLLTARLIDRRRGAERLAGRLEEIADENQRLYAEQRGIAQTLQHALLPEKLPQPPGLQASARYEAGARGVEIGGDWYDLIALDDRRLLLVVGDVSGKGLRAATTMAALRYAGQRRRRQAAGDGTLCAGRRSDSRGERVECRPSATAPDHRKRKRVPAGQGRPASRGGARRFVRLHHDHGTARCDVAGVHRWAGRASWREHRRRARAPTDASRRKPRVAR
jgi:hypothetical protein